VVLHLLRAALPEEQSGYTLRSRYALHAQVAAGLEPVVVTALGFPPGGPAIEPGTPLDVEGIAHHRLTLGPAHHAGAAPDAALRDAAFLAARVVRAVRPSVLWAASGDRGYDQALVALALGERFGLPVVHEVRSLPESGAAAEAEPDPADAPARRAATELRCMQAADHVVVTAAAVRDEIVRRGVPAAHVTVVPNGVDADAFEPRPPDAGLVVRYRLGDRVVIGSVGGLDDPDRGPDLLIYALAALRRQKLAVAALIVGDGRRRRELEQLARRLKVDDGVAFTGAVPHERVADYHALLDAFVVPATDAAGDVPLAALEAMAMARPLVVADEPVLIEVAAPGIRGLTFPVGDAGRLAATLERLVADPGLGPRLGEAGREWVRTERPWTRTGAGYRTVVDGLLGSSRPARRPRSRLPVRRRTAGVRG
jgi:glycosyltransferase involved in cell wall biosynthesis